MKKVRTAKRARTAAEMPDHISPEAARQRLRNFKTFLTTQDPVALADLVADVHSTLASVAAIEAWFKVYAAELRTRRVH